ncbi:hypothetical protein D0862_08300 [Hortaea werneckii]|uniref:SKP1 component POZ domain-containing protein n=1 Tax=Hortaea werneckii TaxID=91943 RepID=A0A3M7G7H5_HORWE|nr:hypothetical protein D0862_08300 [Hortaea werneckii]
MASASSETDYVTLISNDGFSFVVQRSAATISPMVRKMLDPQSMCFFLSLLSLLTYLCMFMEAKNNTVRFDNIK